VRRVATTLGVSRSQLHERLRHGTKARTRYHKSEDSQLLDPLRRLVDERPTYGYRRIGALLNKERLKVGLARLNHKRIYRLMAQNGLLLQRYTGRPPGRAHDGQIITIRPNLRWTSDGFEIAARTARRCASSSHWIPVTVRSWPGAPAPVGSAGRWSAI
jgi:putative transposase